jgi:hypothetical protein
VATIQFKSDGLEHMTLHNLEVLRDHALQTLCMIYN